MRAWLLFICLVALIGCDTTDYEGYKRVEGSVHFKRIKLGDDKRAVDDASFVSLNVIVKDESDAPLLEKRVRRVQFSAAQWPSVIQELVSNSSEGELISIIGKVSDLKVADWFHPVPLGGDSAIIRMELEITEVIDSKTILQLRAEERGRSDLEMSGQIELQNALDSLNLGDENLVDGIYFQNLKQGYGKSPVSGSIAIVQYKTFLANGEKVDDTYASEPFEYFVGKPDQVIQGFAIGLSKMKVGGTAKFVIPHELAYGAKGSSSRIVPPYSALIYEVELKEVRL